MMSARSLEASGLQYLLQGMTAAQLPQGVEISGLSLDSRAVRPGDCFLACPGLVSDGRRFIDEAIDKGAVAVLLESGADAGAIRWRRGVPLIPVTELGRKSGLIASRFFGDPSAELHVVGVTGTNGKTSTSHVLAQALDLSLDWSPSSVFGTIGYGALDDLQAPKTTTPDAVQLQELLAQRLQAHARSAVIEVSSHALMQHRVDAVHFDLGVFTNLSRDHLDYHGDMETYGQAKLKLFMQPDLKAAVVNLDDGYSRKVLACVGRHVQLIGYSLSSACAGDLRFPCIRATDVAVSRRGLDMQLATPAGALRLSSPLLGRFNAANLVAAFCALLASGLTEQAAARAVSAARPIPGRMEPISSMPDEPLTIVDYAHSPDALRAALSSLREISAGRIVCVFGCGGDRDRGKRPLMGAIAADLAHRIVLTNDNPRSEDPDRILQDIRSGMPEEAEVEVVPDRIEAVHRAIHDAAPADSVLLAGKGHEPYQQIGDRLVAMSDRSLAASALRSRRR